MNVTSGWERATVATRALGEDMESHDLAGRPLVVRGTTQLLFRGMHRLHENLVINIKNKSHSVTAQIEVPQSGAQGVIVAQGGNMGGWSLYAHRGRLHYCYNHVGLVCYRVTAASPLPGGTHHARMEFVYDGGGVGKGGVVVLFLDGREIGQGRVERTHRFLFSMDETLDIGCDLGEPVSPDYGPRDNLFNGQVNWVQIDIDAATRQH